MSGNKYLMVVGAGILQVPTILEANKMGLKTIVTDMNLDAPAMQLADVRVQLSTKDVEGHVREAMRLAKSMNIVGAYTQGTDVEVTVAEVAAALGLAEYMVSADASNANFASTMVAEGPVVKTFEKAQSRMIEEDVEVMERVLQVAIAKSRLQEDILELIKIDAEPPLIVSRNRLQETQADEILARNKVMSLPTWAARAGLDGPTEQEQIEQQRDVDAAYGLDDVQTVDGKPVPGQTDPNAQADGTGLPKTLKPDDAAHYLEPIDDQPKAA